METSMPGHLLISRSFNKARFFSSGNDTRRSQSIIDKTVRFNSSGNDTRLSHSEIDKRVRFDS
ncbi:hypothetical protein HanRHA438_Chr13g0626671 [Helianthus annuus]|nr:hypothetical protein HanRHA438_Chr13g0626671 [Helianthus annuus]